jgi:hypothetical protein
VQSSQIFAANPATSSFLVPWESIAGANVKDGDNVLAQNGGSGIYAQGVFQSLQGQCYPSSYWYIIVERKTSRH